MDTPQEFIRRPDYGREGRGIRVRSNFFEVTSLPEGNIFHYDVTIMPTVPPRLNRKIYKQFEDLNRDGALGGARAVFDGRKNMFSPKRLSFNAHTFDVTIPEDDGTPPGGRPPRSFKVIIKKVQNAHEINMEDLNQFLLGRSQLTANCLAAIRVLDILIHHQPAMHHVAVRNSFYIKQGAKSISGGVEVWQGYFQSARPTLGKMLINIDSSATAFYEAGSLIEMVTNILGRRSPDEFRSRGLTERDRQKVEKVLKKLRIRINHRGEIRRQYRIEKLTPTPVTHTRFEHEDTLIDVATYFLRTYNRRLNYAYLPCVVVRGNVYLPMEVCEVCEDQRYLRKLNEKQTADTIKFACQPPHMRANKIRQGLDLLNYRSNEYLQQFGMRISTDMAVVQARVLPSPMIEYHPSSREARFRPRDGIWNLKDKKVATGATLGSWSVVIFGKEITEQAVSAFIRELVVTCSDTGMNIASKAPPIMSVGAQNDVEAVLKSAWLRAGNAAKAQPQLILCVLPNTGVQLYAEIKRVSDTVIGVATQCVQSRNIVEAKKQYCANVCLKMNVKLGGMNSFVSAQQLPFITERPTIVMGADITHPRPDDQTHPSIAGLCASMDAKASRYAAAVRIQNPRTEIISDLSSMVKELLKTFYQTCGRKPERIILYRDGVSDGQFAHVLKEEKNAVISACESLDVTYRPTITFIVVQKRHRTRFFPMDKKDSDRSGNCLPGTVVDTEITHPFEFDFYLQSHAGIQGTSRPAHYNVLFDENNFSADALQSLSYNLCYLYARCTRSVSMVPPVYYAHLVCHRARFHARGEQWSDTEHSEEGAGINAIYGVVKQELQKVMYYM